MREALQGPAELPRSVHNDGDIDFRHRDNLDQAHAADGHVLFFDAVVPEAQLIRPDA